MAVLVAQRQPGDAAAGVAPILAISLSVDHRRSALTAIMACPSSR